MHRYFCLVIVPLLSPQFVSQSQWYSLASLTSLQPRPASYMHAPGGPTAKHTAYTPLCPTSGAVLQCHLYGCSQWDSSSVSVCRRKQLTSTTTAELIWVRASRSCLNIHQRDSNVHIYQQPIIHCQHLKWPLYEDRTHSTHTGVYFDPQAHPTALEFCCTVIKVISKFSAKTAKTCPRWLLQVQTVNLLHLTSYCTVLTPSFWGEGGKLRHAVPIENRCTVKIY